MRERTRSPTGRRGVRALALGGALAATAFVINTGCTVVCTDIGCTNQLSVRLEGEVPETYSVRFEVAGEDPVVFSCTIAQCQGRAGLDDTPAEVTIVVLDGEGVEVARETVVPDYERSQPNGRDCPPTCFFGEVTVNV